METVEGKVEILKPSAGDDDSPTTEKELTDSWTMLDKQDALKTSPLLPTKFIDEDEIKMDLEKIQESTQTTDHEGDISDGISVISDTDSCRQTPPPPPLSLTVDHGKVSSTTDECELCQRKTDLNSIENVPSTDQYTVYKYESRPPYKTVQSDTHSSRKWNTTIILGILAGITAMVVACYIKSVAVDDAVHPLIKFISHRIDRLEADNIALKMEVTRMLDIIGREEKYRQHQTATDKYHQKDDIKRSTESEYQKPHHKQKKVWMGDGTTLETATEMPTDKTVDYCNRNLDGDNDLYAEYNQLKCEQQKRKEEFYKNEKKHERKPGNYKSDDVIDEHVFKSKTVPKYEKDVPTKYREKQGGKNHRPYEAKSGDDWLSDSNAKGEYGSRYAQSGSYKSSPEFEQNDSRRKPSSKKERKQQKESSESESDYKTERLDKQKYDKYRSKEDIRSSQHDQRKGDDANWYLDRAAEREKARTNQPTTKTNKDKHNKYQSEY